MARIVDLIFIVYIIVSAALKDNFLSIHLFELFLSFLSICRTHFAVFCLFLQIQKLIHHLESVYPKILMHVRFKLLPNVFVFHNCIIVSAALKDNLLFVASFVSELIELSLEPIQSSSIEKFWFEESQIVFSPDQMLQCCLSVHNCMIVSVAKCCNLFDLLSSCCNQVKMM